MIETLPLTAAAPQVSQDTTALRDRWPTLTASERLEVFRNLPPGEAEDLFLELSSDDQAELVLALPPRERRLWVRTLEPDDVVDLLQAAPEHERPALLGLLDDVARREVTALLAYAEDEAGGLMSPRFARLRPDMTADEAVRYLRRQAQANLETIYYAYVLDAGQRLRGVVSFRQLLGAPAGATVAELMARDVVTVPPELDQEGVARVIARHDLLAVPVVDADGVVRGIVTVDDVVDVVEEAATEDIQKLGGMEALDMPYLRTTFLEMVQKRAGWLSLLFVGELLTASAMARYEDEIQSAIVLAMFVPLIISSGGNSGSQTATLVIRAMALGEVETRDWWRVAKRELGTGIALGSILAILGFVRVLGWEWLFGSYGENAVAIGLTVGISLMGVVLWGTMAGSMLPMLIRRVGFDPASASAPFVATLIDVTGLVIYFSVAEMLLGGTLL